jgi:hypothetical protein
MNMASINWLKKVWADGRHNAFTDLVKWQGRYFLTFRNGTSHGSMDGRILIISSEDLEDWELGAEISTPGDDRDPKFLITPERLFLLFPSRTNATPRQGGTLVSFSTDGRNWSRPQQAFIDNFTFWRPVKGPGRPASDGRPKEFGGLYYLAAYYYTGPVLEERRVELLQSEDALSWKSVSTIHRNGSSETALLFFPDGGLWATVRRKEKSAALAKSKPPYEDWKVSDLNVPLQGPAIIQMGDKIYAAGRKFLKEAGPLGRAQTALYILENEELKEILILPSGGDTSYPGFLPMGKNRLLMSYYSSHEGPASIYLAEVKVP